MTAPRHALSLLAAALLAGGCATTGTDVGANRNPAAWRPPVADLAARTGSVGARPLRPDDTVEVVIRGGCHSYFGSYGLQDGDGTPKITNAQQISQTADAIAGMIAA